MEVGERDPTVFDMPHLFDSHRLATRLLLLSASLTDAILQWAMDSGVAGIVSKRQPFAVLKQGIRQVRAGRRFYCSEVKKRVVRVGSGSQAKGAATSRLALLTERERQMLILLARGLPINVMAGTSHVSAKTVEGHKYHIMRKLDLHSRIDLARFAFREGIAQP
jgi:DNA-binding NarL/FixJ family response regulator